MNSSHSKTGSSNPFAAQSSYGGGGYGMPSPQPHFGGGSAPTAGAGGAAAPGDLVFDVTEADFEALVLERSLTTPVLLDCWAPWCGPCRSLGPVLEKVVASLGGQVVLAKINTDEAPNLSAALRIRSIPLVVLFVGGRPVDQFVGALPEGQVRQFLERHLGAAGAEAGSPVEQLREEAAQAASPEQAEAILLEALQIDPQHAEVAQDLAERLIARGALDDAAALLERVPADARQDRHAALAKRIEIARHKPGGDAEALAARITTNPRDFEARFAIAAIFMHDGRYQAAFDQLLEVVLRDKGEHREQARKQLIEWFAACPDVEAVNHGRRYLGMYLN